jgi:hypothetical protein
VDSQASGIAFVEATDEYGHRERFTRTEVINRIRNGDRFFVSSDGSVLSAPHLQPAREAWVEVNRTRHGHDFIRTVPDGTQQDNLYALPSCEGCEAYRRGHRWQEGHEDEDSGNPEPDSNPPDQGPPDD